MNSRAIFSVLSVPIERLSYATVSTKSSVPRVSIGQATGPIKTL